MSEGAFRDAATAALERVAALEEEVARLREGAPAEGSEVASLRAELKETLKKLTATERDLHAYDANFRGLRANANASADDVAKLRLENAKLKDQLAAANKSIDKLRAGISERTPPLGTRVEVPAVQKALNRLEKERDDLRAELKGLRDHSIVVTELPENLQAVMKRMQEEREELTREVAELRAKLETPKRSLIAEIFGGDK